MTQPDEDGPLGRWAEAASAASTLDGPAFRDWTDTHLAELELLPPGPMRSRMAEKLIRLLLGRLTQDGVGLRFLDRLVRIGEEGQPAEQSGWRHLRAMARVMTLMQAIADRERIDHRAASDEVDQLAAEFADDPQMLPMLSVVRAMLDVVSGSADVAGGNAELVPSASTTVYGLESLYATSRMLGASMPVLLRPPMVASSTAPNSDVLTRLAELGQARRARRPVADLASIRRRSTKLSSDEIVQDLRGTE